MARGVLGVSAKRVAVLLAVTAAAMFLASGLSPGGADAQTAATNGKIAYVGFDDEAEKQDIYTINPDGTGVVNLTSRYTSPTWSPLGSASTDTEWSPDGTSITFQSRRAGQDGDDRLVGVNGNDSLHGGPASDTKLTDTTEKSIIGFP